MEKIPKSSHPAFEHPYPPVMNTARYICEEIKKNVKSSYVNELISLITHYNKAQRTQKQALDRMTPIGKALIISSSTYSPTASIISDKIEGRIRAYSKWRNLVAKGKPWDHKQEIREKIQGQEDWACDNTTGLKFMYDIWSNIHYGFVGRYVGFTEFELINGAGMAQINDNSRTTWQWIKQYSRNRFITFGDADILGGLDDAEDTQAIKIGFSLFHKFGPMPNLLTSQDIINEILIFYRNHKPLNVEKCEYHHF